MGDIPDGHCFSITKREKSMKRKCGGYWLGVGLAIMVFMTCSFTAAANKVVVIPLGGSSAVTTNVKVYDNSGQYLGVFVGNNGLVIEILVPTVGKILAINRELGVIKASIGYWYYMDANCNDGPYLRMDYQNPSGANLGILYTNDEPNCDFFGAYPLALEILTMHSRRDNNGYAPCLPFMDDALFSPITTYTESEVGFSHPISYPLEFRVE